MLADAEGIAVDPTVVPNVVNAWATCVSSFVTHWSGFPLLEHAVVLVAKEPRVLLTVASALWTLMIAFSRVKMLDEPPPIATISTT